MMIRAISILRFEFILKISMAITYSQAEKYPKKSMAINPKYSFKTTYSQYFDRTGKLK